MLYEVITRQILRLDPDSIFPNVKVHFLAEGDPGSRQVNPDRLTVDMHLRITSYNVCYTKLLRCRKIDRMFFYFL